MIDPKELRNAFGKFMTGVTVVTTIDPSGAPIGFTANSFSSVSLDPPLLLVCPAKSLSSFDIFNNCSHFHVSVLADNQQTISNIFASSQEDRFSEVDWTPDHNGCPTIDNALASFSCSREQSIDAGDHIILLGKVVDYAMTDGQGLGYGEGGYFSLDMERKASELQAHTDTRSVVAGALVEYDGKLFLMENNTTDECELCLPQVEIDDSQPSFDIIKQHLSKTLEASVHVGSVFSIFEHKNTSTSSIYYRAMLDDDLQKELTNGQFYSLDQVAAMTFKSNATKIMIQRYIAERKSGNHGIYVGTDASGTTHKLTEA